MQPVEQHCQAARTALMEGDRGGRERAKLELKISLQSDPLHADSHSLLACLLAEEGEIDQAIVGFQRALMLKPDDPGILYNLGTTLMWRGEPVRAARLLEQAVSIRPDHLPGYNNLAKAYFLSGLPEMAVAVYREALARGPGDATALRNLALLAQTADNGLPAPAQRQDREAPQSDDGPEGAEEEDPRAEARREGADEDLRVEGLQEILRDLPHVTVERRGGRIAVAGWTSDVMQREILTRILTEWPDILDLTTYDVGDSTRMIEVDAVIFVVLDQESDAVGFDFLRFVRVNAEYFAADHRRDGTGFSAPGEIGDVTNLAQEGWIFSAGVLYDVNIANARDEEVALLARPHLTTLSGTPATFLAGGELVFQVAGNISGDIEPYPFGTTLTVTPTLLRTPDEEGNPRIHIAVQAGRTSILSLLAATAQEESTAFFSKFDVSSEAILSLGQTLILSGLNQRESNRLESGVPILRSIPILEYFFSTETIVDSQLSVIVLLTPRDPGFVDDRNQRAINDFVEMRRAFVRAVQGTEEDILRFRERYPAWDQAVPNRFASHLFLTRNSELYRSYTGQDLSSEDLEYGLLGPR